MVAVKEKAAAAAPSLNYDPVGINWGRAIPPESEWPGRRKDEQDVIAACGDGRDWFRYWHRQKVQWAFWESYERNRQGKTDEDYYKGFEWNQRLIIGIYGAGKTVMAVSGGLFRLADGFPYFDNGPGLVGWHLEGDEIFTAMARIPPCSVLLFDEAHTSLPGRLGGSTAVSVCQALGANIRKINCQWDIVSAQHNTVHRAIRQDCVEVVRPFKCRVERTGRPRTSRPWDDPANFVMAWDVWEGSPFSDPEVMQHGVDVRDPDYWMELQGESARNGYVMTDTFRLVDAGAAILANKEGIKDDLRRLRGEDVEDLNTPQGRVIAVVNQLAAQPDHTGFVSPADIAEHVGAPVTRVGQIISELFGVSIFGNHGYPVAELAEGNIRRIERGKAPNDIPEDLLQQLKARREQSQKDRRTPTEAAVLEYVKALSLGDYEKRQFVKPGEIAKNTDFDGRAVGVAVGKLFAVTNYRAKGYSAVELVQAYKEYEEVG